VIGASRSADLQCGLNPIEGVVQSSRDNLSVTRASGVRIITRILRESALDES
jgi:hypothetical protein